MNQIPTPRTLFLVVLICSPLLLGTDCDEDTGAIQVTVRVNGIGNGSGTVTDIPNAPGFDLDCSIVDGARQTVAGCEDFFEDTQAGTFELDARAADGHVFSGWTCAIGAPFMGGGSCATCSGVGLCALQFDADREVTFDVTARFDLDSGSLSCVDMPLARWPLDGDAQDVVGTADGPTQLPAGIVAVADRNGVPGGALQFDGTAGLDLGVGTTFDDLTLPFSFSGWIWRDADGPASGALFATDDLLGRYHGAWAGVGGGGGFGINYGNGGTPAPASRRGGSAAGIPNGQWVHVIGVIRGATDVSIYLDGVAAAVTLDGVGVGPITHDPAAGPSLGSYQLVEENMPWKGRLDEFRLYSCALDDVDAATLAAALAPARSLSPSR